ncbi:MAG: hypothetical protein J7L37_00945 [Thermococcus sp.]|nr:hypothetical protein [Thermococcus sp.]
MADYDSLEAAGAITAGLGLLAMVVFGAIGPGLLIVLLGTLMWKEGETRRNLADTKRELESLKAELESLKGQRGDPDG